MDVVITAGGRPLPGDSLFSLTKGGYKALLDMNGKPLIQWILDSLNGTAKIGSIVIVGLPPQSSITSSKPITFIENKGDLLGNIQAGGLELLHQNPATRQFLIIASDVPAVTPAMLDWLVDKVLETDHELYYFVVERSVMEKRYPGSKRTYLRMKDVEVCGGDIHAGCAEVLKETHPIWKRLIEARKNPLKQAWLLGLDTLLMIFFRQMTIAGAERSVSRRVGLKGRVIICPFAELGMDIDKPFQFQIVEEDLAKIKT
jgi:GTP:adenosylcobinamide-phosphate guanylyltransferase